MTDKPDYSEAFRELQDIVTDIEEGQIDVDVLSEKVKRAAELIRICKEKLYNTSEDVQQILKELEKSDAGQENHDE